MSTDKQQILETITAVSRLITLAFKPVRTKVAIRDHNVVLCEPNTDKYYGMKFAQAIDRRLNGDSREDIWIINQVLANFINWYVLPYKDDDAEIYDGLINMTKFLCVALKKLQETYKSTPGNVMGTLQYYIIVLNAVIEDKYYPGLLYTNNTPSNDSLLDDEKSDDELIYSTIFDIDKFRNFWTRDELKSICDQFLKCFKLPDNVHIKNKKDNNEYDDLDEYKSYHTFEDNESNVSMSDDQSSEKNIPCYKNNTVNQQFILPIPKNKNNAIVKGHLVGINNILDTMDRRFRIMLNQSVKGTK